MSLIDNIQNSRTWLKRSERPLIVAGPCSVESESQVMQVAQTLSDGGHVDLFRGGIWKPRSRPGSFQGVGGEGLAWLAKAQQEFGIPAIIEVANASHVRQALDAGIKHLWVGARTTGNPFSVEEIASAMEGEDIPVLVKNPMNPDLQLWIGALERFVSYGITKLVAVHRGFNTYNNQVFRNSPNWEIPIDLKSTHPNLEVIVDPSHIGGRRDLLQRISQRALDLGFDGLMVETHPHPDEALSDPEQQIAVNEFNGFIEELELKQKHFKDSTTLDQLEQLRIVIDEIDQNLLENFKRRLEVVEHIGQYKAEHGVMVFQLERWKQIMQDRIDYGKMNGIDVKLIQTVWNDIHNASIRLQTEIVKHNLAEKS